jgi:hypothetical protein
LPSEDVACLEVLHRHTRRSRDLIPAEARTDHDDEVAASDLAELNRVIERHRNASGAGVALFLHNGMAFLDRHLAALRRDRNGRLADLSEDQLIHFIRSESALAGQAPEQARPIIFVD